MSQTPEQARDALLLMISLQEQNGTLAPEIAVTARDCLKTLTPATDTPSDAVTITVPWASLETAVDAILLETLTYDFTDCRNLETLVAECGSGCEDDMAFLRAARASGININERLGEIRSFVALKDEAPPEGE